jgi:hypothetical protein
MSKKLGNLVAHGGSYHTQDGQEKVRWIRCGVCIETDNGLRIKIESIPVNWDGWLSVMPDDKQDQGQQQGFKSPPSQADDQPKF